MSSVSGATGLSRITASTRYGQAVNNPTLDPALSALLPPTVQIKDLLGNDDAPKMKTTPRCACHFICVVFVLQTVAVR
jgi:hypothetical protein